VVVVVEVVVIVVVDVVVGATVVVVVEVVVVVVVDVVVGATLVVVVVVVGGGRKNGPPQPHLMSTGAPRGVPRTSSRASRAVRNCCQPSHAEMPVVGQPPFTCAQAAV
jgi:hypothetical protein